jgi:hypothetical protein
MTMHGGKRWVVGVVAAVVAAATGLSAVAADDPAIAAAFGSGVHAYYAGAYQRSYDELTAAIEGGSSDPRAFYFRGLAALKLGRLDEAEADFASGATREAKPEGSWNVPRSLERIQGEDRLRLERHRARARVVQLQRIREANVRRYTEVDAAQESVLRRRRPETAGANEFFSDDEAEAAAVPGEALPEPVPAEPAEASTEEAPEEDESSTDTESPFGDDAPEEDGAEGDGEEEMEPSADEANEEGDFSDGDAFGEDEAEEDAEAESDTSN